jgi:sugar lactone lactonase YvrE
MQRTSLAFFGLTLVLLAGCGGGAHSPALPAGQPIVQAPGTSPTGSLSAQQMNALRPASQSPASFKVAPMQLTAKQPASAMASLQRGITPQSVGSITWSQVPGVATSLAVANDGALWALSTLPAGANKYLWHYSNGTWTNVPGSASSIAVGPDGTLYAVNSSSGGVYAYNGLSWSSLGGGANWVTTGIDGSVYVLSNANVVNGDSAIWKYKSGVWTQQPGAGAQLAGSYDPNTYVISGVGTVVPEGYFVVNAAGSVYYNSPGIGYVKFPGAASSVAPTTGGVFALGYPASSNGEGIYYFGYASAGWITEPGSGASLAAGPRVGGAGAQLYVTTSTNAIWTTPSGTPIVSTFAGSTYGFIDGTGTAAEFNHPTWLAVDGSGNVYVSDTNNNAIRKITPGAAVITLAIHFSQPLGVAVDSSGSIYVADSNTYSIKKVTPDGVVTATLAGNGTRGYVDGPGSTAEFNSPNGLAVDANNNVYVADTNYHVIRKITPAGVVSTFAGSGGSSGFIDGAGSAARFNTPTGIAVDGNGNLFVADWGNNAIREISPTGSVTTLAGNGTAGYHDGTGPGAEFNKPDGVSVDASGIVYVTDYWNHVIRAITPGRVVTTLAGNGTSGFLNGAAATAEFAYPTGIAVDASGRLYTTDDNYHTIRKTQ